MRNLKHLFSFALILIIGSCQFDAPKESGASTSVFSQLNAVLENQILKPWYPLVLDKEHGGYLSNFDYKWQQKAQQNKMIVTQARHLWTASKAALFFPENTVYKESAAHGLPFLKNVMWDQQHGGFYNLVSQSGQPIPDQSTNRIIKQAYGNAFAIYGLAAYYQLSQDTVALNLAIKGFLWLEKHSHDSKYGGYFQFLEQDGTPLKNGFGKTPPKDQNSSIHLMEAFSELYAVWPDELVKTRLEEMLVLIRDTMTDERGFLNLFFQADWTPLSYRDSTFELQKTNFNLDHVSFGHDIETAWLMMEATERLGNHADEVTLKIAKKMTDHGLKNGFDNAVGGVYDGGYYFKNKDKIAIVKDSKNWWAQVETLNTLLFMANFFPDDEMDYYAKFLQQWDYIQNYLIDYDHGGFYAGGLDKESNRKMGNKSGIWKGAYHTTRSLMNCVVMNEKK